MEKDEWLIWICSNWHDVALQVIQMFLNIHPTSIMVSVQIDENRIHDLFKMKNMWLSGSKWLLIFNFSFLIVSYFYLSHLIFYGLFLLYRFMSFYLPHFTVITTDRRCNALQYAFKVAVEILSLPKKSTVQSQYLCDSLLYFVWIIFDCLTLCGLNNPEMP